MYNSKMLPLYHTKIQKGKCVKWNNSDMLIIFYSGYMVADALHLLSCHDSLLHHWNRISSCSLPSPPHSIYCPLPSDICFYTKYLIWRSWEESKIMLCYWTLWVQLGLSICEIFIVLVPYGSSPSCIYSTWLIASVPLPNIVPDWKISQGLPCSFPFPDCQPKSII